MSETHSTISQRIRHLVDRYERGNKLAFSKRVGMSNQSLGEIVGEKGTNPSFLNLARIAQAFPEISNDWLLLGEGEMLKSDEAPKNLSLSSGPATVELNIAGSTAGNRVAPLINYKAAANYLTGYQSQELYEEVEQVSLPREIAPGKQRYTCFYVTGESMEPTMFADDIVICQQVRPERWLELRGENLLVVVSRTHGIQVKRATVRPALRLLRCRSDNPRSIPFDISLNDEGDLQSDVLELWMVEWLLSKRTEAPERQSTQRINTIENEVGDIRYLLESLIDEREMQRRLRERDRQKEDAE